MKTAFQFYPEGFDIFFLILQDPTFDNFCQCDEPWIVRRRSGCRILLFLKRGFLFVKE